MIKRNTIITLLLTVASVFLLLGCSKGNANNHVSNTENVSRNSQFESFLVYTGEDDKHWDAHYLGIDLDGYDISMDDEIAFSIYDENEWTDNIYPIQMYNKQIILRNQPREIFSSNIEVSGNDNQIMVGTNYLNYDRTEKCASVYERKSLLGIIEDLEFNGYSLNPLSFFIDTDGKLILACSLDSEEVEMSELIEFPLIVISASNNEGEYAIETMQVVSDLYNEALSVLQMPNNNQLIPNIFADSIRKKFYWREGRNIVEIDPYLGSFKVILKWDDMSKSFAESNFISEGYSKFVQYGRYKDINIVCFEDYSNGEGLRTVFINDSGSTICSVLISRGLITIYNKDNQMMSQLENDKLKPIAYIGVQY